MHDFANKGDWSNLKKCCSLLGFSFCNDKKKEEIFVDNKIIALINELIKERNSQRVKKNYNEADRIRKELLNSGVVLKDNEDETEWEFLDNVDEKKIREILK